MQFDVNVCQLIIPNDTSRMVENLLVICERVFDSTLVIYTFDLCFKNICSYKFCCILI